jgi:hypothetical protein
MKQKTAPIASQHLLPKIAAVGFHEKNENRR